MSDPAASKLAPCLVEECAAHLAVVCLLALRLLRFRPPGIPG